MSVFQPYIDAPYPNFALEEAERPAVTVPVAAVLPASAARQVEASEDRPSGEDRGEADAMELSATGKALADASEALQRRGRALEQPLSSFDPLLEAGRIRSNAAMRDLLGSFDGYDNSAAVARYIGNLDVSNIYGAPVAAADEGNAVANIRAREDALYISLGAARPDDVSPGQYRDDMMRAIDRWLAAAGVFLPGMLRYSSSDGFRFAPLSRRAEQALRGGTVMATYDRSRIARHLRETAALEPTDFMFYDPTGLGDLPLRERRLFMERVDDLLRQQRIDARAAELRYRLDENQRLVVEGDSPVPDAEDPLAALDEVVNDYYSMLKDSVKQYNGGIISQMFG